MKSIRTILLLVIVVAVLFASTLSAGAIGFEAEVAYESVFVIYSGNALGSGFAIGENCIVTNAHVIDNPRSITIETYGGEKHKASVLGMNEEQDIAILIVDSAQFPYLAVADLTTMRTGDDIYAIGAPKGMAYTLTKGGISAKERVIHNQTYIQIDAPINEGNSGGPLLNDAGQVLGMNTLKMSDSEGIGLAIPVSRVCDYLRSLDVELNANGNVVGRINTTGDIKPSESNPTTGADSKTDDSKNQRNVWNTPVITGVAVVVAVLSLFTNVVLAVLLAGKKKQRPTQPRDPRERTDFEIDIWE